MIDYFVLCSGIKNILLFGGHRCDSIPYVMLHPVALQYVCIGGLERFGVNETGIDTKTRGFSGDLHPIDPQACRAQWLIWVGTSHRIVSISRELRFVPKSRCCPKTEAFPSC